MSRGVLLFAFNNGKFDYYAMAVATAKRINHFLGLPVSVVTDLKSSPDGFDPIFDQAILSPADTSNIRDYSVWINKGRYRAYALSPYDETILLDTDYMVNSDALLKLFDLPTDFCCHNSTFWLMQPNIGEENLGPHSLQTRWATVVMFKKTKRAEQIFQCMRMIQDNYDHYANLHGFIPVVFRNDYALTLALRRVNGHSANPADTIPWNLVHAGKGVRVHRDDDTTYMMMHDNWQRGKIRKEYIMVSNTDFHMIDKQNFMEIV